jgi:hypothetical protein
LPTVWDESDARNGRQRGRACCEMQELATGKFHSCAFIHHLVSAKHEADRDFVADRLCGLEIDYQLEVGGLLNRDFGRLGAA